MESQSLAISAAETGQLVLGSLHTQSAIATVDRILDAFPADQQSQVRSQLSESLKGIVAQRLLKRADGRGRVAAIEILFGTPAVSNLIREKKTFQLASVMQTGKREGMLTFEDSVLQLVRQGVVHPDEAAGYGLEGESLDRATKEGATKMVQAVSAPDPRPGDTRSVDPRPGGDTTLEGILNGFGGAAGTEGGNGNGVGIGDGSPFGAVPRPGSLAARVGGTK